jgi:hypothetical protein
MTAIPRSSHRPKTSWSGLVPRGSGPRIAVFAGGELVGADTGSLSLTFIDVVESETVGQRDVACLQCVVDGDRDDRAGSFGRQFRGTAVGETDPVCVGG